MGSLLVEGWIYRLVVFVAWWPGRDATTDDAMDDDDRAETLEQKNNVGIRVCKKIGDSGGIRYLAQRCIASVQII